MATDARKKADGLSDDDLLEIVDAEIMHALGSASSKLIQERADSLKYYLGEPFGNEVEGQSQVVVHSVADTVEWVLPSLLKIFTSGDEVVRFEPRGPDDEEAAAQQTEYINYIWYNDGNAGFMTFHTLFKDELIQKNGILKTWWEEREERKEETFENQSIEQIQLLTQPEDLPEDERVEIAEQEQNSDGTYDITLRRWQKVGRVKIDNIPPEEFVISRDAKSIQDARLVGHRSRRTVSDLVELGYDYATLEEIGGEASDIPEDEEELVRRSADDEIGTQPTRRDRSQRQVWYFEGIVKADVDGDGISEDRFVALAGEKGKGRLLANKPWGKRRPFAGITPCPMPHRFVGRSLADMVMDLQLIESTILRMMLNSGYAAINPMKIVADGGDVDMDALLTPRVGGVVRAADVNAIREIITPFIGKELFPVMEWLQNMRENRTGVTRYNQGLDSDSLNKTARGISQIMSASQQRIELIARIAAETGIVDAFRNIQELVIKHQRRPRMIRLRNKWVEIDPRAWTSEMDVKISVGLGTGNKDQMLQHLQLIAAAQEKIIMLQGGPNGPIVDWNAIYKTASKIAQNAGFKDGDQLFIDPSSAPPQQPPGPSPEQQKMQAEMEMDKARLEMDAQRQQMDVQAMREKAAAEIQIEREKAMAQIQAEREKATAQIMIEREKAMAKANLERELGMMRETSKAALASRELEAKTASGAFVPQPKAPPEARA